MSTTKMDAIKAHFSERYTCIEGCQKGNCIEVRDADVYREEKKAGFHRPRDKLPQHIREQTTFASLKGETYKRNDHNVCDAG